MHISCRVCATQQHLLYTIMENKTYQIKLNLQKSLPFNPNIKKVFPVYEYVRETQNQFDNDKISTMPRF